MALKIHNNLTNRKEEFVPLVPGKVSMYVCGVTVYDDIHMGHARSMIVFDTIARYLRHLGYEVTFATNFTDVDDKILIRAAAEGIDPLELSARYIEEYFKDAESLGIGRADIYPKASESIDDIIAMVRDIIGKGHGYAADDGSVYFSVRSMPDYGKLSNRRIEDLESSGRTEADANKRDPLDFAVWKGAEADGLCIWESPWGCGRPGWHIECSAMIRRHFGDTVDIHGGGNDLIFPHHENEILQSEAVTGKPLANYWIHNGMLQVKGVGNSMEEKMSKSLGNFFRVKDVAERYDSRTIRFYFLNTHYSSPLVYGEDMLAAAQAAVRRLWNNHAELKACMRDGPEEGDDAQGLVDEARTRFAEAMDDDFNTRAAIEALFQLARATNRMMGEHALSRAGAAAAVGLLEEADAVLGILGDADADDGEDIGAVMDILIGLRRELRSRKLYDLTDRIRDELAAAGYALEDTADGVRWKRI